MKLHPVKSDKVGAFSKGKQFNMVNIKTFLFKNIGIRQTILKNTTWLTVAEVITRLLGLAVIIGIVRILGAAEYGKFAFAFSFVSLLVIFSNLGVAEITTRELSKGKETKKDYPAIISLKIILTISALILMVIGSFFLTSDLTIQKAIWALSLFILITSFFNIFFAFFRAEQRMEYEAVTKILQSLIITVFAFFVLFTLPSVKNLSFSYFLANLIIFVIFLIFFHIKINLLKLSYNKAVWKKFLKNSWPLTLGFSFFWVYGYLDSIILGSQGLITETGWYNAVLKIATASVIPAMLISKSFYPVFSKFSHSIKEKVQQVWNYHMETMIVLSFPIMVGGWVLAPKIVDLFYGPDFQPAALAFKLLIIVAGISFFYFPFSLILVAVNQQKKNFSLILLGALINIILSFILVRSFSLYGIAAATIISSAIVFLLAAEISKYFTPISPFNLKIFRTLVISIFASMIMLLGIRQPVIYNLNVFFTIVIGGLIYSFVLLIFFILSARILPYLEKQ